MANVAPDNGLLEAKGCNAGGCQKQIKLILLLRFGRKCVSERGRYRVSEEDGLGRHHPPFNEDFPAHAIVSHRTNLRRAKIVFSTREEWAFLGSTYISDATLSTRGLLLQPENVV
jgi:hypothetical protein